MMDRELVDWSDVFADGTEESARRQIDANPRLIHAENSYSVTLVHELVAFGFHDLLREILRRGAEPNALDQTGYWPLRLAVEEGDVEALTALLDAGAHPDHPLLAPKHFAPDSATEPLDTALRAAATGGNVQILRILLGAGADPNLPDVDGWTPLHAAACTGHAEATRLLLDAGADPRLVDDWKQTPGELAWEQGHSKLAKLLGGGPPPSSGPSDGHGRAR